MIVAACLPAVEVQSTPRVNPRVSRQDTHLCHLPLLHLIVMTFVCHLPPLLLPDPTACAVTALVQVSLHNWVSRSAGAAAAASAAAAGRS